MSPPMNPSLPAPKQSPRLPKSLVVGGQHWAEHLCLSGGLPLCEPPSLGEEILSLALMVLTLSPVMVKTPPSADLASDMAKGDSALPKITQVE